MSYSDKIKIKNLRNRNISNPIYSKIVKNELVLYLDGKDFKNNPPTGTWKDRSQGSAYTYANKVLNGDFSNGTTGWGGTTISGLAASNNEASFTITAQNGNMAQTLNGGTVIGNKYYVRAKIKTTSNQVRLYSGSTYTPHSGSGNYETLSLINVATGTGHGCYVTDTRASGWDIIKVQYCFAVDLTALFGAGNEPSKEWCDANLGFVVSNGTAYKGNDATASNFNYVSNLPSSVTTDFANKVSGSVVENPNIAKFVATSTLNKPTDSWSGEVGNSGTAYSQLQTADGVSTCRVMTSSANAMPQLLCQFDLIRVIEKAYGKPIPTADGTVASKIAWIKANISSIIPNWYGYGVGPLGNKASFKVYTDANGWNYWGDSINVTYHTANTPTKLGANAYGSSVDNNGFVNFLAYADAARATDSTYICLTNHGLGLNGDVIENVTRGNWSTSTSGGTTNSLGLFSAVTGQVAGDTINKYKNRMPAITAGTGTTTTNLVIPAHGLATGDYIKNSTRAWTLSKVTVLNADTVTCNTAITGQAQGDVIYLYPFLGTQIAEGLTNNKFLGLNAHGLSNWDIVENTTRNSMTVINTTPNANGVSCNAVITGQVANDNIDKYHSSLTKTAEVGTTDTVIKITNHGLPNTHAHYIKNSNQGNKYAKVTVTDANTLTIVSGVTNSYSNIVGQTTGDSIILYPYLATQTANDIVIPSTIYTDYINLQINFVDTSSGSDNSSGVYFDGIDDYVSLSDNSSINFINGLTMEAVIKSSNTTTRQGVICKDVNNTPVTNPCYSLEIANGYALAQITNNSNTNWTRTTTTLVSDGTKKHIVVTYDNTTCNIYVNGVLKDSNATGVGLPANIATKLNIGQQKVGSSRFFIGTIYASRIYNRVLSQQEILQNYNASR